VAGEPTPLVEPREAYALWADTYPPHPHNPLMETEQQVMAPLLAAATPKRALDVGTGTGRNVPLLSAAGARTVIGLELSMAMLARGLGCAPQVCADALKLPFADRAFDTVCSSLMVGDLGRTELAASAEEGARQLFKSVRRLKELPDYVEVLPGAYAGSVCGRRLSGKPSSAIGFEKRHNQAFTIEDEAEFVRFMVAEIPPAPPEAAKIRAANSGAPAAAA
jgi:SAM-dependent methyltransferase